MSTQRRENHWQHRSCTEHAKQSSQIWLTFIAWFVRAIATVGTAPPKETGWFPTAWTATNSLQSGYHITQLGRQDLRRTLRSSPPRRAGCSANLGTPATRRLSLPLIPSPSVLVYVRPSLPLNGSSIDLNRKHLG
jgi:hypothetical protein